MSRGVYWLLLALVLCAIYFFGAQLWIRIHYQQADNRFNEQDYQGAVAAAQRSLELVERCFPGGAGNLLLEGDLFRLEKLLGDSYLRIGVREQDSSVARTSYESALAHFARAREISPEDMLAEAGVARSVARLEYLDRREGKENGHNAYPLFEKFVDRFSTNYWANQLMVDYLGGSGRVDELRDYVPRLAELRPTAYYELRKQAWFSDVRDVVEKHLLEIGQFTGFSPEQRQRQSYQVLSSIAEERGDYAEAVRRYEQAMQVDADDAGNGYAAGDARRLGGLLLKTGSFAEAAAQFTDYVALSEEPDKALRSVWGRYRAEKRYREFLLFVGGVDAERVRDLGAILSGEAYLAMERYPLAQHHLEQVTEGKYLAERYRLRALISEKQNDWDEMELAAQKSVMLAPDNAGHHLLFSQALARNNKLAQAEDAADAALDTLANPNPWYQNHRAWLRWRRGNYAGAGEDWQRCVELKPDHPEFYYTLALAREKLGTRAEAIRLVEEALEQKPGEAKYLDKLQELRVR